MPTKIQELRAEIVDLKMEIENLKSKHMETIREIMKDLNAIKRLIVNQDNTQ